MRGFYCGLLGMTEIAKPPPLAGRGGFWAQVAGMQVHFGIDPDFHPAMKAHPAFLVADLAALAQHLEQAGVTIMWDRSLPDVARFFVSDPVGNRIEFMAQPKN